SRVGVSGCQRLWKVTSNKHGHSPGSQLSAAFTRRTTGGGDFFRGDYGFTYSRLAPCPEEAANCGRSNSPTRPSPYIWSRPLLPRSVAEAARPRAASAAPVLSGVLRRDASSAETIGAANDVPRTALNVPSGAAATMADPGAAKSTCGPRHASSNTRR